MIVELIVRMIATDMPRDIEIYPSTDATVLCFQGHHALQSGIFFDPGHFRKDWISLSNPEAIERP